MARQKDLVIHSEHYKWMRPEWDEGKYIVSKDVYPVEVGFKVASEDCISKQFDLNWDTKLFFILKLEGRKHHVGDFMLA